MAESELLQGPGSDNLVPDFTDLRCTETMIGIEADFQPVKVAEPRRILRTIVDDKLPLTPVKDLVLLRDPRVVDNLLRSESAFLPATDDYFRFLQPEVTPAMRKIVTDWMLEVCQETNSPPEVFCLAVNCMDRFLAKCHVPRCRFQLVGTVCLLTSSKFKDTCPIPGDKLIAYTDNSVSAEEIRDWELIILNELGWELSFVSPLDFLDHIFTRLSLHESIDLAELRPRIETILVVAATDYTFTYMRSSLLAAAAVLMSVQFWSRSTGLDVVTACGTGLDDLQVAIANVMALPLEDVIVCCELMHQLLPKELISPIPVNPETSSDYPVNPVLSTADADTRPTDPVTVPSDATSFLCTTPTSGTDCFAQEDCSSVVHSQYPDVTTSDTFTILVS